MEKIKCPICNQTLFMAHQADLQIKCQRCKNIITVKFKEQSEPHKK